MVSVQLNEDWQSTKHTILARNSHMLHSSDMSDISFTCEGSDKTFHAHKYVLGTSSAVFHAMFYGGLAVKDSVVHLSDTKEENLEQFLRFLYTEECIFTEDNVVGILYLAKKYIVPSLSKECVDFLVENVEPENVFESLELAARFDQEKIEKRCWLVIQCSTGNVVASDSFNNISQTTLYKLLKRDKLNIREVDLFQAVLKWIDFQCSSKNLEPTGENKRSIIGRAIYEFRFFGMTQAEFVQHVSKTGLLTAEELVPIFENFAGFDSLDLKWKLPNREPGRVVRFSRFPETFPENRDDEGLVSWDPDVADRLCFSVDEDALLLGVRLFGMCEQPAEENQVTFEVKDVKVTDTFIAGNDKYGNPGFDVLLKSPMRVNQDEVITLSATIRGQNSLLILEKTVSMVTRKGATLTFSDAPEPNNGTNTSRGQFHEIILAI